MRIWTSGFVSLLVGLVVAGCSGIELSLITPQGVDLSGEWVLDFGDSDEVPNLRNPPLKKSRSSSKPTVRGEALRLGDGTGLAFVAHDFQILRADKIQIEQGRDSMGIRYYPGIYRDITWGERQRGLWEVNAGWQENDLVIDSETRNLSVREHFMQTAGGQLVVLISVEADGETMDLKRTFKRRI